ncbi:membrane proteins related to metalloendopeptidases [Longilinea arvoryzae]|uniref:Membrane proteins related to metalloendopeptidases n=1 Tax=Longilinea arvoryzae TaxID=360412 RepID=A0A0S7BGI7_9CHLR|nr:M23 family metallopeptidase [Longilinea arvoryzae]GAP14148.1 membrane proteins related to metalloendopeptidases [Longilinea arvoryzae]
MMRHSAGWVTLGLLMVLAACSPVDIATRAAASPSPISTNTPIPQPTVTATATVTATIEPTLQPMPLNPSDCRVDSCTLDGDFWLQRPVDPPAEQHADNSYLYGSSQNGKRIPHSGVEFYNATGTPVLAAADGRVVYAGNDASTAFAPWTNFYGNLVVLEHATPRGEPFYTLYAHLSEIDVQSGTSVQAGQVIAKVGMSGSAIGSHLHFEVRTTPTDYTATRNPFLFLTPLAGTDGARLAVLAGQIIDQNGQLLPTAQLVAERADLPENSAPQRYYLETYTAGVSSDPAWQENFVLGDLEPGRYRISFVYDGRLIERFVTLSAGQLTYLSLQVEN